MVLRQYLVVQRAVDAQVPHAIVGIVVVRRRRRSVVCRGAGTSGTGSSEELSSSLKHRGMMSSGLPPYVAVIQLSWCVMLIPPGEALSPSAPQRRQSPPQPRSTVRPLLIIIDRGVKDWRRTWPLRLRRSLVRECSARLVPNRRASITDI